MELKVCRILALYSFSITSAYYRQSTCYRGLSAFLGSKPQPEGFFHEKIVSEFQTKCHIVYFKISNLGWDLPPTDTEVRELEKLMAENNVCMSIKNCILAR
jgi:hypothetical protein